MPDRSSEAPEAQARASEALAVSAAPARRAVRSHPALFSSGWSGALRPGGIVGRYELVRELGRGRCGVVYEARDRELDRRVALKALLLRGRGAADARQERLLRELEVAARLRHANLAAVYAVERDERGPFVAVELLQGEDLDRRLSRGALAPDQALSIAIEVAKGLAHAHARGVVHGALTARDVFLCDDGTVKLTDLGAARALGRWRASGSAAYRAPEQRRGAPEDERADVFALGVLLSRMVEGRRPLLAGWQRRWRRVGPEPAPVAAPALRAALDRMLSEDPTGRPRDGREALAVLSSLRREGRGSEGLQPRPRARRRPSLRLALAALLVAGALGAAMWMRARAAEPDLAGGAPASPISLAVLAFTDESAPAGEDASLSDGMAEELAAKLSRLRGLEVASHASTYRYRGPERGAKQIGRELGVAYLLEGSVRRGRDSLRVRLTLDRTADEIRVWNLELEGPFENLLQIQGRVAVGVAEALGLRLLSKEARVLEEWGTRSADAYVEYLRGQTRLEQEHLPGNLTAAIRHLERAVQIDPAFAPALASLASAEALAFRGLGDDPERLGRAAGYVRRALGIDPDLPSALLASGDLSAVTFKYAAAADRYRQVVARDPRHYFAWDSLCWVLGYLTPARNAEAEAACRRSIAINPAYGDAYYHLERVLIQSGRLSEAARALAALEERYPESYLVDAGRFWLAMGGRQFEAALRAVERPPLKGGQMGLAWKAMALAQLGEADAAFASLSAALDEGYRDWGALQTVPELEPLRRDPRYVRLLAKHGVLSPETQTDGFLP